MVLEVAEGSTCSASSLAYSMLVVTGRSAPRFQRVTRPSRSITTVATGSRSTTARSSATSARSAANVSRASSSRSGCLGRARMRRSEDRIPTKPRGLTDSVWVKAVTSRSRRSRASTRRRPSGVRTMVAAVMPGSPVVKKL